MIEIRGIKISVEKSVHVLEAQIMKKLRLKTVPQYKILKRSIDARKKPNIYYVYHIGVFLANEERIVKNIHDQDVILTKETLYEMPKSGSNLMLHHPLIIGSGPSGLFCGLILAKMGYAPIIVERGLSVEQRVTVVNDFFSGKPLDTECNVQFGEGGAGTFSDGKLNTQVKDKYGRIQYILKTFVKHGAPEEILYDHKPHIGTDLLVHIIKGIRQEIEHYGGRFLFNTKATDLRIENQKIKAVKLQNCGVDTWVESNHVILAIGHSARDTYTMLYDRQLTMKAKDFAMGVRIEHPVEWIQKAMYGTETISKQLPAAPYKVTHQTKEGRGVYSFCMCPGGYVVNASSELNRTAINGMSYSGRNGNNSNSAIVVSIKSSDFEDSHPLAGITFQRNLEEKIFNEGNGKIVVQRFEDFCNNVETKSLGIIKPETKGEYMLGNVTRCLPDFMTSAIIEGIQAFEHKISGFAHKDAIVSGVESRTSSPVRIERNEHFIANIDGIYPCGEGAGYAGGIMSAAMDGMKVAEAIIAQYKPKQIKEKSDDGTKYCEN